jgi:hypothetical protein
MCNPATTLRQPIGCPELWRCSLQRRTKYIDADYLLAALFMLVVILIAKG